ATRRRDTPPAAASGRSPSRSGTPRLRRTATGPRRPRWPPGCRRRSAPGGGPAGRGRRPARCGRSARRPRPPGLGPAPIPPAGRGALLLPVLGRPPAPHAVVQPDVVPRVPGVVGHPPPPGREDGRCDVLRGEEVEEPADHPGPAGRRPHAPLPRHAAV